MIEHPPFTVSQADAHLGDPILVLKGMEDLPVYEEIVIRLPLDRLACRCSRRELPMSEDGYPLIRTVENMYWPTMATIDGNLDGGDFTSDMLRDLAKWLGEVADEVDRIDAEIS
mgnify:CR=1 FL=1